MNIPRIVIAGTHSGCGKTTTASGIMAALTARGLKVQPFKVGPDFIDPSHHTIVCGRESRNLDPFMMGEDGVRDCFARACAGADIAVIEGVMGLYDGVDGSDCSSTAHVARLLDAPVILIADIKGMSRSVAALIRGYAGYDPRLRFAGVIMTKGGSARHKAMTTGDMGDEDTRLRQIGSFVEEHCDLDAVIAAAGSAPPLPAQSPSSGGSGTRTTIAVAMDAAFCFYYRDNFDYLRSAGSDLIFFSPLADPLPQADAYYFGGGYPRASLPFAVQQTPVSPSSASAADSCGSPAASPQQTVPVIR